MAIFIIALPDLLAPIKSRGAVWSAFVLSILPVLQFWDARLWPNEAELAAQIERRNESKQLRELATSIHSEQTHPFLAPWWLSPSIAYWSGQPGVAGSSHEALEGIADSARFFMATDFLVRGENDFNTLNIAKALNVVTDNRAGSATFGQPVCASVLAMTTRLSFRALGSWA